MPSSRYPRALSRSHRLHAKTTGKAVGCARAASQLHYLPRYRLGSQPARPCNHEARFALLSKRQLTRLQTWSELGPRKSSVLRFWHHKERWRDCRGLPPSYFQLCILPKLCTRYGDKVLQHQRSKPYIIAKFHQIEMSWSRKRYPVKTGAITYNCAFEICVCVKYGLFEPGTLPKCCTLKEGITKEFCDLKGGAVTEMRLLKVSLIPEGALETRELSEVSPVESCLPDELGIHEPETSCKPRT